MEKPPGCLFDFLTQMPAALPKSNCFTDKIIRILCTCVHAGLHSSYAGHSAQLDPELRAALSPDCHMTPVFDEHSFHSPLYHSPTHDAQGSIYRTSTGTTLNTGKHIPDAINP